MTQFLLLGFIVGESTELQYNQIIETGNISVGQVSEQLDTLANNMKNHREENFHTSKLIMISLNVEDLTDHLLSLQYILGIR
jgi:chemotaxis protein CheY-P-specific phosphatase CheC